MGGAVPARAIAVAAAALAAAGAAAAQDVRPGAGDYGGFRNVLPGGQGETVNAAEFGAYQAADSPPGTFTSQLPLYTDLLHAAPRLDAADLDRYFKPARFGVPAGDVDSTLSPRPGVTIVRDKAHNVPHVYGATREDTMFGAGYASAQDRLFFMDVLRHAGRARLSELIGPGEDDSNVKMDAEQLKVADYSEDELQRMLDESAAAAGSEGQLIRSDLLAYVDGVNAYIREARADPRKLPVEYPALGKVPADWKPTDTVAVASLIGGIFGRGGGAEANATQVLQAAYARFGRNRLGARRARATFSDFRRRDDPEAPVTVTKRFPFDDSGKPDSRAVAMLDLGSIRERNPVQSGSSASGSGASAGPAWLRRLQAEGLVFPDGGSNALLVRRSRRAAARPRRRARRRARRKPALTGQARRQRRPIAAPRQGRPVAVMGPQVGYFTPQVLMELDLHGPGIDARGATFPGISLYVLLGRGQDFAWSATTATTDVVDEFVEKLCEPDGSRPTLESQHYLYRGRCVPLHTREHVIQTTPAPADLAPPSPEVNPPRRIVMKVERSVHGPIQARATVNGEPVAIAEARSTYFHELDSAVAFKRLNGNEVHDARSFQRAMNHVNFAFNWFYVDDRDISFLQSGWFPRRAAGVDQDLPAWGTGEWDWQGFDPQAFTSARLPFERLPKGTNPPRGYLVNWNNKQAPGWRAADDLWVYSSVHRSNRLEDPVRADLRRSGRIGLTRLTQIMELGATIDLRGQEVYPWVRRVIGRTRDPEAAHLLGIMDAWSRSGAHRRDLDRDNVLDDSAAVMLMDAWWPRLVRSMFEPTLGRELVGRIETMAGFGSPPPPSGSAFFTGWWGYVDKDLRRLLGKRVRGPLSRRYCGGGSRRSCSGILVGTLKEAAAELRRRHGLDPSGWRRPATCARTGSTQPRACDQIEFITAGAVATDPIHWQDRPTFQQVVEVQGHRPR